MKWYGKKKYSYPLLECSTWVNVLLVQLIFKYFYTVDVLLLSKSLNTSSSTGNFLKNNIKHLFQYRPTVLYSKDT